MVRIYRDLRKGFTSFMMKKGIDSRILLTHPQVSIYLAISLLHWPPRLSTILESLDFIQQQKSFKEFNRIIDIGCGPGRLSVSAIERGFSYVGIDNNKKYIDYCKKVFSHSNIKFILGDASTCFPSSPSDIVIMNGIMHHLKDQQIFQIIEMCKQSRAFIVSDHLHNVGKDQAIVRLLQRLDRGKYIRKYQTYEQFFREKSAMSVFYPINVMGVLFWNYFTDVYLIH